MPELYLDIFEAAAFLNDDSIRDRMPKRVRGDVLVGPRASADDLGLHIGNLGESFNGAIHALPRYSVAAP